MTHDTHRSRRVAAMLLWLWMAAIFAAYLHSFRPVIETLVLKFVP